MKHFKELFIVIVTGFILACFWLMVAILFAGEINLIAEVRAVFFVFWLVSFVISIDTRYKVMLF